MLNDASMFCYNFFVLLITLQSEGSSSGERISNLIKKKEKVEP